MKAARIHSFGSADVIRLEDIPVPTAGPGSVLIRVQGSSVNPIDYKIRSGQAAQVKEEQLPITLGRDIAGVVEHVGDGVRELSNGQAVYAQLPWETGGNAEYVALDARLCAQAPKSMNLSEAGAVPLAALTAWQGLFVWGELEAGQTVLIHGSSGGVGHLAVQFAKAKGARIIATASKRSEDFIKSLGADRFVDSHAPKIDDLVQGVDLVLDLVGGDGQARLWNVLKSDGILVSTLGKPANPPSGARSIQARGYQAEPHAEQLVEIASLIDAGQVRLHVEKAFSLNQIQDAHRCLETEHPIGKIVISVG
ncbi:MAG: NADP-dependent oxidoreductase [Burkholderiaceae bacterium]